MIRTWTSWSIFREGECEAWDFAEELAAELGLTPDVHLSGWTGERLRDRIAREGHVLG